ncbi:hypothetical protein [Candidatus Halobonum tyrrellensis]|uniref:Uncharacterized protein n=1 Tax=Candidatus Halobonum tyrrellensis G22 TaxID=1324957 RepID=V4J0S5_9EURY|nr:hypothetical protein [Candidatus Halobonum tyrrellensis]ESP89072.1 hypothetical protein K933_05693 [Candidatus Halobonum tyrrellensis G22]
MNDESVAPPGSNGAGSDGVHGWLAAADVAGLVALAAYVVVGVFGDGGLLASASGPVRLAAVAFVAAELLIPVWVFLDVRRRPEMRERGMLWVPAAAMPVLNVFGLAAYLVERDRKAGERAPDER